MIFLYAFLIAGLFCMSAQILLDNTKLTPGHITSIYTVLGACLSFLGIYQKLIDLGGAGATIIISNFGHLLYQGGYSGFHEFGFIGFFSGLLVKSSAAIVAAVVFSFIFALIFKPKN